ncbi:MAG: deoxyribodipyrimidine photo-lyase [Rubrivivax sp.]
MAQHGNGLPRDHHHNRHHDEAPRFERALVWLRRDLRVHDHAALAHALAAARQVWCCFVFDRAILDPLLAAGRRADRRVEFIRDSLVGVDAELRELAAAHGVAGAGLIVRHGLASEEVPRLASELHAQAVFASHDDEPAARERDLRVHGELAHIGVALHLGKDQVVFERNEGAHRRRPGVLGVHAVQGRVARRSTAWPSAGTAPRGTARASPGAVAEQLSEAAACRP